MVHYTLWLLVMIILWSFGRTHWNIKIRYWMCSSNSKLQLREKLEDNWNIFELTMEKNIQGHLMTIANSRESTIKKLLQWHHSWLVWLKEWKDICWESEMFASTSKIAWIFLGWGFEYSGSCVKSLTLCSFAVWCAK